jgi:hypothetical protein
MADHVKLARDIDRLGDLLAEALEILGDLESVPFLPDEKRDEMANALRSMLNALYIPMANQEVDALVSWVRSVAPAGTGGVHS